MKVRITDPHTNGFVCGIANVSEEIAARLLKSGQAEIVNVSANEEKAPEIPPLLSPENTGSVPPTENEETITDGVKTPEDATKNQENV